MELERVIVTPDTSKNFYFLAPTCTPGAVAANSPVLALINPASGGKADGIEILSILLNLFFFGTAAASQVAFAMRRFSHATGYTGGAAITVAKANSANPGSSMGGRIASTGVLTDPGVNLGADILAIGTPNQLIATASVEYNMRDYPLVLAPGEGIVLYSLSAVLASTTIDGSIQWRE